MAIIPKNDPLTHELNSKLETSMPRPYLGLSQVGNSCHRFLQYYHYWAFTSEHSTRLKRLFQFGHRAEPVMISALAEQGIEVTGCQDSIVGVGGHWKGHVDGRIGDNRLFEAKTHNDKSFKDLKKKKVKESKPGHYDQVVAYMGYLGLDDCLYMAENKNDSEYYIEIIPMDHERFKELKQKQAEVIMAETLLPKIGSGTPAWFECKFCEARSVCHKGKTPAVNCRTCKFVDVLPDGEWACSKTLSTLTIDEQKKACDSYHLGDIFR